jgi:hypothetical protein
MEAGSNWYNRTVKAINFHKDTFNKKEAKKYKLDLLLRLVKRVDDFSAYCGECQIFQQDITRLAEELGNISLMSKENHKSYNKTINNIVNHLQKKHKLVNKGHYLGIGIGIGMAIGAGIGTALGNPGIGPGIGIALGVVIGRYLDKKAEREGRVI